MQKPLSAIWNFLLKWAFLSGSYIYVQLFHFNCIEMDLYIAIRVKVLNPNIGGHLEDTFASELFICISLFTFLFYWM